MEAARRSRRQAPRRPLPETPDAPAAALKNMADPAFLAGPVYQDQQFRARWPFGLDKPDAPYHAQSRELREWARAFIRRAARVSVPLFVAEAERSRERQRELQKAGRSKLSLGAHCYGLAVDVVHSTKGWSLTAAQWALLGQLGKEVARARNLRLVWGGDWEFYDPAHWELRDWRKLVNAPTFT
jgi:hypothetical protein